jgi:TfoX/Sxy family transcriptional regulator of competence genes
MEDGTSHKRKLLTSLRFYIRIKHEQLLDQQLLALNEFITAIKQVAANRDQSTKKKKKKILISFLDLLAVARH